ncbi:protein kinase [Streptomyces sp. SL13]|uniref:non-specific serine/threonine protein kinase n=1 Tax=Streptantibioticus silvisoli TaxID=2705255 RepID=A0AA90H1M9_9ACTN|nr:protein kinase [Streptantibioticus silvisoli]MDI5969229.1 protein kinase [Streptantibioticus silvisoli]
MDQGAVLAGRYAVAGLLGAGGMAEVYRAHDLRLDRDVAVKVLRAAQAGDAAFRIRFRREALAAASLNHPRIVAVFDAGDEAGGTEPPFIVMEYVEGHTLSDLVRDSSGLDVEQALRLTTGVLDALEHAHEHGIVHRDIKPANVMLSERDGVKVMDFGIARPVGVSGMTVTGTAMVVGTAEYLSPEQARGLAVDARCDLYSAGCLLYELLTGRPPFVAESPLAVAWKHVEEEPLAPSTHVPGIPAACDAVVLRALAKDREDRYPDAAAMRAAVQAALRAPHEVPAGTARFPAAATAAAPVAGRSAGVAHSPTATAPAPRAAGGRAAGRRPPRRGRRIGLAASAIVLVAAAALGVHALSAGDTGGTAAGAGTGTGSGTTATGKQMEQAPDLRGQTMTQARRQVLARHLRLAGVRLGDCPALPGGRQVCSQQPAPGSRVTAGTGISVQISAKRH